MRPRLAVVVQVAAGGGVGLGHLMRSAALAEALRDSHGASVHVVIEGDDTPARIVQEFGFTHERVSTNDALETLSQWTHRVGDAARVLIVDRPSHAGGYLGRARAAADASVLVCFMDGIAFQGPIDVAVNGNAYWESVDWSLLPTRALGCFGPGYLCLRRSLVELKRYPRSRESRVRRILITMGGGDPLVATPSVVRCLGEAISGTPDAAPEIVLDVVLGASSGMACEARAAVDWLTRSASNLHAHVHHDPVDFADLMMTADLAISAGGSTLYELALMGTPTVAIPQTRAEVLNTTFLAAAGTAMSLPFERSAWKAALPRVLSELLSDAARREALSKSGMALVDGQGAQRVASAIVSRLQLPSDCS